MADYIQANLKPETVERIAEITGKPVTRGIDKMFNECLDLLSVDSKEKQVRPCSDMMELIENEKEESQ